MASKEELKQAAEEKGLTVTRQDGKEGEPTAADYQHALDVDSGALMPDPPAPVDKTFMVTSPFGVLGAQPGETVTVTVDPDGVIRDSVGRSLGVEALLVEQGAITEVGPEEVENG